VCGDWSAYVSSDDILLRFTLEAGSPPKRGRAVLVFGPTKSPTVLKFHLEDFQMADTELVARGIEISTNRMVLVLTGFGTVWGNGVAEIDLTVALLDAHGKPPLWSHRTTARRQRLPSSHLRELEMISERPVDGL
jgi:hypothetical protein